MIRNLLGITTFYLSVMLETLDSPLVTLMLIASCLSSIIGIANDNSLASGSSFLLKISIR